MGRFKVILTGTGRCATGFYAKYLTSAGLTCGHERFFSYGGLEQARELIEAGHWRGTQADSSWMVAPFLNDELLSGAFIVHLLRHPRDVIASWLRVSPEVTPQYQDFRLHHLPRMAESEDEITRLAYAWMHWNRMIERQIEHRDSVQFKVEREPIELLKFLMGRGLVSDSVYAPLFDNKKYNTKVGVRRDVYLDDVQDATIRAEFEEMSERYGYVWPIKFKSVNAIKPPELLTIKAIITTLDNLDNLRESVLVLRGDPLIGEIIVVNNGSIDGTRAWLDEQTDLTVVHRENRGAGPGRNTGLDAAGDFDFALMLDGGIRPLRGGTARMLDYLQRTPGADVIGIEIADFETDRERAWRRWPSSIEKAYHNTRLSHTAYCLCRARAWDGLRFSEEGPFGEPGWGADDDEMAYQWGETGITVHVCTGIHPYRHASGSFRRLHRETGIWPNQYGSIYEKRVVWLQQNWPQYDPGLQWGEPWLTVVVQANGIEPTAKLIKAAHDRLRERKFKKPWQHYPNPYSIVAWGSDEDWLAWAEPRRLRQHHGDTIISDGEIVRRSEENEATWTGDFRVWTGDDWWEALRPNAHYYGLATNEDELGTLLAAYDEAHPPQPVKKPPDERMELCQR